MAFAVRRFLVELSNPTESEELVARCELEGIAEAIDFAMLDDDELSRLCVGLPPASVALGRRARQVAKDMGEGWSKATHRRIAVCTSPRQPAPRTQLACPPDPPATKSIKRASVKAAKCAGLALQRAVACGSPSGTLPVSTAVRITWSALHEDQMAQAARACHVVFTKFASSSPHFRRLAHAPQIELDLQFDLYIGGSRSAAAVRRRATAARSFFLDIQALGWQLADVDAWRAASWVKSRVVTGLKTAGSMASATLKFVGSTTGNYLHHDHALVIAQSRASPQAGRTREPSASARVPSIDMIITFEQLVTTAPTPQVRVLAGFFAMLAHASARCLDGQRSRRLAVVGDSLRGEAIMKNSRSWTKWFCDRRGVSGNDWATAWLHQLSEVGLPGEDFVCFGFNTSLSKWIRRPAVYADFRRALHVILCNFMQIRVDEAVEFTPHGFRHVFIVAGQQLRAVGRLQADDLLTLGHWKPGSAMPRAYDSQAGVSELSARMAITDALRAGWRPVQEGDLPQRVPSRRRRMGVSRSTAVNGLAKRRPVPSSVAASVHAPPTCSHVLAPRVLNTRRRVAHRAAATGRATICRWWTCGTPCSPAPCALFTEDVPQDYKACPKCG